MSFKSKTTFWKSKPFIAGAIVLVLGLVVAVFILVSGGEEKEPVASTSTTEPDAEIIAPLTGLVDPTGETLNRPALAVKIGNNPEARPQAGINEADVIYEEIVEGGVTRYLAVYHSTVPERVGPVRSVRAMDPDILLNWGGIFAYSGGAAGPEQKVQNTQGILALNETKAGEGMRRDSSRRSPNNLYAIPSVLFQREGEPIPPVAQFEYSDEINPLADPASSFLVGFQGNYASTWTFSQEQNKYLRSYPNGPVVDQTGEQTAYDNVIVQFISYPTVSGGETTGNGDAWIFRNGRVIKGTWDRPNTSAPAEFKDIAGETIKLMPGRTWVALASRTTTVTIEP